jgi:hypothetical protein
MMLLNLNWEFLSKQRRSIRFEIPLNTIKPVNATIPAVEIGDTYTTITDNSGFYQANSTVESIEYVFGESPRMVVSTQLPEMPNYSRLARTKISDSEPKPKSISDSRDGTIKKIPQRIAVEEVKQGQESIPIYDPQPNMWRIIVGKQIGPLNLVGCKRLTSLPTSISPPIDPNTTTTITQDGFAIVQNTGNGEKRVIVNCDGYSSSIGDLYAGQTISLSSAYIVIGDQTVSTALGNI